ncbi:MAG: MoaD/ThiS family protein [Candidatus Bathyarchaeota archaeon]|nr:MoaD/ThiS family protein [Candidatus Bathyarchaeota archaeon]
MAGVSVGLAGVLARIAGEKRVTVEADPLGEVLDSLASSHGEEFRDRLFDDGGRPRRFINIYVSGRDYRFLDKLEAVLQDWDVIALLPAVSGG